MNPTFKGSDVILMMDGQVIGKAQSLSQDRDYEVKPIGKRVARFEGSFTATGGITKAGEDFFNSLFNPTFDIEVKRVKYEPPRKLRSKKKRLVRKWRKKYTNLQSKEVYKNCTIKEVYKKLHN